MWVGSAGLPELLPPARAGRPLAPVSAASAPPPPPPAAPLGLVLGHVVIPDHIKVLLLLDVLAAVVQDLKYRSGRGITGQAGGGGRQYRA